MNTIAFFCSDTDWVYLHTHTHTHTYILLMVNGDSGGRTEIYMASRPSFKMLYDMFIIEHFEKKFKRTGANRNQLIKNPKSD
jgi:hypothetical protein